MVHYVFLATTFNLFLFEGKNAALILFATFGFIALVLVNRTLPANIGPSIFVITFVLIVSYAINFSSAETVSFLYSLFFIASYILFTSYFKARVPVDEFRRVVVFVLGLYLVVLIMGQLFVLFGLFDRTLAKGENIVHGPFGTLFEMAQGYRFYSLATEPSYAAFVVITLLWVYLRTDSNRSGISRRHIGVWLICTYMILSFQSVYGLMLFGILILSRLTLRNSLIVLGIGFVLFLTAFLTGQAAAVRLVEFLTQIDPGNITGIRHVDYSASFRILPTYFYIRQIDLASIHFYFGHGAGQGSGFLIPLLFQYPIDSYEGGFFPQFLYDYGIVFFVFFIVFLSWDVFSKVLSFELFLIILLLTNANFNTQLFWFVITSLTLARHYRTYSLGSRQKQDPQISSAE